VEAPKVTIPRCKYIHTNRLEFKIDKRSGGCKLLKTVPEIFSGLIPVDVKLAIVKPKINRNRYIAAEVKTSLFFIRTPKKL